MGLAIRLLAAVVFCAGLGVGCGKEPTGKSNAPPAASEHGKLPKRERQR